MKQPFNDFLNANNIDVSEATIATYGFGLEVFTAMNKEEKEEIYIDTNQCEFAFVQEDKECLSHL